jgi:glucan biosynthesis protein C
VFRAVTTRRWGVLVLAGVTTITLLPMKTPTIETSAALVPPVRILVAYGVFFAFGWLLFSQRELVASFAARWRSMFAAGMAAAVAYIAVLLARRSLDPVSWHVSAVIADAVAVWLLIFGITGAFVRYLSTPRPLIRYFSDASYWMYLLHVIPITWCAGLLARSNAPAFAKFGIVLGIAVAVTVVTYHYFVRSTAVGELLNGRRYQRRSRDSARSGEIAADHQVKETPVP